VPPDNRVWFDDDDGIQQRWLQPVQQDKDLSIGHREARFAWHPAPKDVELMP
jgi:hypothetical protein